MNSLMKFTSGLLLSIFMTTHAQDVKTDSIVSHQQMGVVIDSLEAALNEVYVFPEVAERMADYIRQRYRSKVYTNLRNGRVIADQITEDLRSVSNDKHLRLRYDPSRIAQFKAVVTPEDSVAYAARRREERQASNYGFKEVRILDGNIGYLDLRAFQNTDEAGETAIAAMNFLSNADALIIDLRKNGGGSPTMIQLLTSYLYGNERVHLNNFYWRPTDNHTQTWTLPYVPGKRRPDIPVYILTSNRTFSAAEEFTYNLKNLERATIIGETTGGGAHPGGMYELADTFMVFIPSGRAINPVTNTNWEGVGITPHIKTSAATALHTARQKALEDLMSATDSKNKRKIYERLLMELKSEDLNNQPKG